MAHRSLDEFIDDWLETLAKGTAKQYRASLNTLEKARVFDRNVSLQSFALINHDSIVDQIKQIKEVDGKSWEETTKQARAACYVAFTRYLSRKFQGKIQRAIPCREGNGKTFYRVYEKVQTEAMNQAQWCTFFQELEKGNPVYPNSTAKRDCLIAKVILQGAKRVNEVLTLTTDKIDWNVRQITFKQSKTKGNQKETIITYPKSIMDALKEYIGDRQGLVFISKNGGSVIIQQLALAFERAGTRAGIPFKITPHVLRASAVTYLKQQGFSDTDIMKVTGHASAEMIVAYDKSSRAENASKKVSLVS
jgi:integrase